MYAELVFCMYTDIWNFYNKIDRGKLFLIILISYILVNDIKQSNCNVLQAGKLYIHTC
jgi:hypothetical protein